MTRTEVLPVEVQLVPVEVPEKCQECVCSPIFPCFIIHGSLLYFLHTSKSFQNHLGISFLFNSSFNFISSFKKTFMDFFQTLLIWVKTNTQAKPKDFLGFTLNPNSIACHITMNPTSKRGFPTFLVDLEYLPTLPSINL